MKRKGNQMNEKKLNKFAYINVISEHLVFNNIVFFFFQNLINNIVLYF